MSYAFQVSITARDWEKFFYSLRYIYILGEVYILYVI